ncbi:hypothetical protein [Actinoplanes siamensis]|uniref:Uncharacterized protein n=1 Tax=Actinoplanes siamensis TaxID=1223317 RepID=A0A919TM66_9ACTN|nr:hypothetical protein [Actinoplanes siamensis]GIF06953.1 hypothetical protein Asi03nite_44910 [Actinoplanes siamensis]
MTHPRPNSPAAWPLRWLLAVLTLAGLGLFQGAHCADTPATHTPHVGVSRSDRPHAATHATVAARDAEAHSDGLGNPGHHEAAGASADDCDVETRTAPFTVTAAAVHVPVAVTRVGVSRARTSAPRPRHHSTVTLSQLGVSRI